MVNLPNILPINIVGTISGTTASGTPTEIFSLAAIQNVVIINEDPVEVTLAGGGISTISGTFTESLTISGVPVSTGTLNVAFRARQDTVQSIPSNSFTTLEVDEEIYDLRNNFDPVTTFRFTAPEAGIYNFQASVRISGLSAGDFVEGRIRKNNVASIAFNLARNDSGGSFSIHVQVVSTDLAVVGDFYEFQVRQTDSVSRNTTSTNADHFFEGWKL